MSGAEKELEEKMVDVGSMLLSPPSDVDELLPLLNIAESLLSRVEQSPSESMSRALHPAMKGLIAKELLRHSDEDVQVAVASCISEITRITAPDAPYDDDRMREIFQMIVKAFGKLDDVSSCSYSKRVAILETVAKVRACVVMLDLECDALILEMFHHFLTTIRDNHPENVFSSMELIMTLVLEESEDISSELVSFLLTSVKKDKMDVLPIAWRLAEKVISNCALKLKPCLMEVVQSLGAPLSDYSKVIATVCHENSDVLEQNGLNASGDCLADDSKFSERTVSDELAQGSGKMESEVSCPEVGTASGRSPKSVMSNGKLQNGNDGSLVEPTSPNKKTECSSHTAFPKNVSAARREADRPNLIDVKNTSLDHVTKKTKGHKSYSEAQLRKTNDHSQIVDGKGDTELPNKKKGRSKEADNSQSECLSSKKTIVPTQEEHKREDESQTASVKDRTSVILSSSNEMISNTSRPKRGRPPGSQGCNKKGRVSAVGDVPTSPSGSSKTKVIENTDTEAVPSPKKDIEGASDSDPKPSRWKKGSTGNVVDAGQPSSDSHGKMEINVRTDEEGMLLRTHKKPHVDVSEGNMSRRRQGSKTKVQKKGASSYDNEMIYSPKMATKADKDQNVPEASLKSKSRKKRARGQASITPEHGRKYDESLVGATIRVWWPDDAQYYPGVVKSYDPISKKHKVLYFDGDEEVLLMKNETFEFTEGDEEDEAKNALTPESASATSHERKKWSDSSLRKMKASVSSKSGNSASRFNADGTESEGKHGDDDMKLASGWKGGKFGSRKDVRTTAGSKSRDRSDGRPSEAGITPENEQNKATGRTSGVASRSGSISRPGRKPKDDTPIAGNRSKGRASTSGSRAKEDMARSGSKLTSDSGEPGRKSKEDGTARAMTKRKRASTSDSEIKSDGDGSSVVVTSGSSRGQDAEDDPTAKVNSATGKLPENDEKSRKKRRRKSQG